MTTPVRARLGWLVGLATSWMSSVVEAQAPAIAVVPPAIRVDAQAGLDCPSAAEVSKAVNDRLPGAVGSATGSEAEAARLVLTPISFGAVRVELVAISGALVLERTLEAFTPATAGQHAPDAVDRGACVALADTVSLIVQRYYRHLEYHDEVSAPVVTPPPAPAPAASIVAAAPPAPRSAEPASGPRTLLVGAVADVAGPFSEPSGNTGWTPSAGLSVAVGWQRWMLIAQGAVGGSVTNTAIPESDGGTFSYRPVSLRLTLGALFPFASGTLIPTVGGGADLLFESAHALRGGVGGRTTEPVLEAGARFALRLGRHAFIEPHLFGVLNLQPHDFQVTGLDQPVLRTPRVYARAGLSFGFAYDVGI